MHNEFIKKSAEELHVQLSDSRFMTSEDLAEEPIASELDDKPIEEGCQCPACQHYSRAYIRHLLKAKEMLGMRLCVLHNLYFYNTMMEEIREALDAGRFHGYKEEKLYRMNCS